VDLAEISTTPVEHRHPWEVARVRFFSAILGDAGLLRRDLTVLDVGAGDAWVASQLAGRVGPITCWDPGYREAPHACPSGLGLRFVTAPPEGERWDLALLLDVIEHVEDDVGFLRAVVQDRLAPEGSLLVSVPAWPWLFSEHDRFLHHHRRYTPSSARAALAAGGLEIVRAGGLFHAMLLPRALQLACESLGLRRASLGHVGQWRHGALVSAAALGALRVEGAVSRFAAEASLDIPGLSWWALCRRPS
jgi:hypothetical protein